MIPLRHFGLVLLAGGILIFSGMERLSAAGFPETDSTGRRSIVIISDTQSPMWFEELFVRTHNNDEATTLLFRSIAADTTVASVFFLGDITAMSSFHFHWERVDTFLAQLQNNHVRTYAAAGNHDYLLTSASGEAHVKKRFPDFQRTGYTVRQGSAAFILLNSNFKVLSDSEEVRQSRWYQHELASLDNDSTLLLIAVACHHSPYSNSSIVGHSDEVRTRFVPPFLQSKKARIFLSGHAHLFQHFIDTTTREQKHFLVLGGGGGLLHTRSTNDPDDLTDQIPWDSEYRMFHYIQGSQERGGFLFRVNMLKEDLSGPFPVYNVFIPAQFKTVTMRYE